MENLKNKKFLQKLVLKQGRIYAYNVTLVRVRVTTVVVEKQ